MTGALILNPAGTRLPGWPDLPSPRLATSHRAGPAILTASGVVIVLSIAWVVASGWPQFSPDVPTTLTYSVGDLPDGADVHGINESLRSALDRWEDSNPNLRFVESVQPVIRFTWEERSWDGTLGTATCNLFYCTITIAATYERDGRYIPLEPGRMTWVVMHETGHVLGLGHTHERSHLMAGTNPPPADHFDDRGFVVPPAP